MSGCKRCGYGGPYVVCRPCSFELYDENLKLKNELLALKKRVVKIAEQLLREKTDDTD